SGVRLHHRLDPGAVRVSGQKTHRRAHRYALRPAHRGLRYRAHHGVCAQRLDRPLPGALGRESRVHLGGRDARADTDQHAVRGARGAAGAAGGAARSRGGGGDPRCAPLLRVPSHHPADGAAGAADRLHAGVRARARGVRLGHFHRRQPADEDRDHPAPHRHPPRAVRLPGSRRARRGDARDLLRPAVRYHPGAGLGPAAARAHALMAEASPLDTLADEAARPGQHTWVHAIVRWLFISVSLTLLAAVLLAPLATVFAMALARGLGAYLHAFTDPDTAAAIRLTLLTAAVVVP